MSSDLKAALLGKDKYMVLESERLASFKGWPPKPGHLTPLNMAKAGLYYTPGGVKGSDCVRCFCCYKELENWDDDDEPWTEHLKHEPSCLFARMKTEEENLTLSQLTQILTDKEINRVKKQYQPLLKESKKLLEALEQL